LKLNNPGERIAVHHFLDFIGKIMEVVGDPGFKVMKVS
jgi:hypothetical protein